MKMVKKYITAVIGQVFPDININRLADKAYYSFTVSIAVLTLESQRENLLADNEEEKMKSVIDQDAKIGQDANKMN